MKDLPMKILASLFGTQLQEVVQMIQEVGLCPAVLNHFGLMDRMHLMKPEEIFLLKASNHT
jgi:hypothetical protein